MIKKCPECGSILRMRVSLWIDAPAFFAGFTKETIRSKEVELIGTNWNEVEIYCPRCKYEEEGLGPRMR